MFGDINNPDYPNNDVLAKSISGDKKFKTVFENAGSRVEQDLIVAAIIRWIYPKFGIGYKCLKNVDLSYQHVISDKCDENYDWTK